MIRMSNANHEEIAMSIFSVGFVNMSTQAIEAFHRTFPSAAQAAGHVDDLHAVLKVEELRPGEPEPSWDKPIYEFKSKSGKQLLYVHLDAPSDGSNGPLYYIDFFTCEEGDYVKDLHRQVSPHPPSNPKKQHAPFPKGTTSFVIEFNMPASKVKPFKFSVYVRKRDTTEIHDADPQAGNDPPPAA